MSMPRNRELGWPLCICLTENGIMTDVNRCSVKPHLQQGNMLPGNVYVARQQVARSGNMLPVSRQHLLFIYVTVDMYPFVSSNRRATNWQQFCCRYTP